MKYHYDFPLEHQYAELLSLARTHIEALEATLLKEQGSNALNKGLSRKIRKEMDKFGIRSSIIPDELVV